MRCLSCLLGLSLGLSVAATGAASAAEPFRYTEGVHATGKFRGELKYVGKSKGFEGVPVLILEGPPAEKGKQIGELAVRHAKPLFAFPRDYFRQECTALLRGQFPNLAANVIGAREAELWPKFQNIALKLKPNFPAAHLAELEALIEAGKVDDPRQVIAANGMFDLENIPPLALLLGCSSALIPPDRSATGGLLFGRNLDFPHFGYLQHYSLLMVYRSEDKAKKHSFVSAGFPGFVGCFTGMNDAGLTLASHSVIDPVTKLTFDDKGVPFAMAYRRVLEECATVDDAVKLLRGMRRASVTSLAVADAKEAVVIEVTPTAIAVRRFGNKPGVCTNHFRAEGKDFRNPKQEDPKQEDKFLTRKRFDDLTASVARADRLGVADVQERMHAAKLMDGKIELTIHTFVFEPGAKTMHVRFSAGSEPATGGKLTKIDLTELWGK